MKLTIFGATGGIGQQIVQQAVAKGYTVTAFARTPEKLTQEHGQLTKVKGDVLDIAAVDRVVQGQDAVLCALGMPVMDKSKLRAHGTENIVRAMEKMGVKRLVYLSALGVGDSRDILPLHYKYLIVPLVMRRLYADHAAQEAIVEKSRLDWVSVRPANFTEGVQTGLYWHGFVPNGRDITLKISHADVAEFMLKQLVDDAYLHKTPCISY